MHKAKYLLGSWKQIFLTGPTDLGFTDLIKHEIKLVDETSFKVSYRRIPPALFEEACEHQKEMLDANVILVHKNDGALRLCIDFHKLNGRTVRDAYS